MKYWKKIVYLMVLFYGLSGFMLVNAKQPGHLYPQYREIQKKLAQGWNTWNTRSVLSQVFLPEGFCINLAFKQHYWLEEKYLPEALIGRYGKDAEEIRPGPHAYDGSFTRLDIHWQQLNARIETAHQGDDLVILVTPKRSKIWKFVRSVYCCPGRHCLEPYL